ncbi:MAG: hypothetical protein JWL62_3622 [Hyphomicrobiales bacterium]|nr:hypothetical protein [Hyphomicrobiales bacterium]
MSDSPETLSYELNSPRAQWRSKARGKADCADVTALVRAALDELRESEIALERQLGELRVYLGHAGIGRPYRPRLSCSGA